MRVFINLIPDTTVSKRFSTWAYFCSIDLLWSLIACDKTNQERHHGCTNRMQRQYVLPPIVSSCTFAWSNIVQYSAQHKLQHWQISPLFLNVKANMYFAMERNLEKLFVMIAPTFVDLQGFAVLEIYFVKEVTVKKRIILSHYILVSPIPWNLLTKSEKSYASWLIANHYGLQWEDRIISYNMAKWLITMANGWYRKMTKTTMRRLSYIKRSQKCKWLKDMLKSKARDDTIIETLNANYENVEFKKFRYYEYYTIWKTC